MAWDFRFDPLTRDLVIVKGSPVLTEAADTMVFHQLSIHFNAWWGAPKLGSSLHDLRAFGSRPEVAVPDEARRALKVVADRGRIAQVLARAEKPSAGRVNCETICRDVRTNTTIRTTVPAVVRSTGG